MYSEARTYLILAGWKLNINSIQICFIHNDFTRKIIYYPSTEVFLSLPTSNKPDPHTSFVKTTAQNATIIRHGGIKTLFKLARQQESLLTQ